MKIAGGFYLEEMLHPFHQAYLGSGLRAAAALAGVAKDVELWSFVSEAEVKHFQAASAAYGVRGHHVQRSDPISFCYLHGCSRPVLSPDIREIATTGAFEVSGDAVLRFGFLEGSCVVSANRAVYDPQSEVDPQPFMQNGSAADSWAMVLNGAEAESFTGLDNPEKAARLLRREHGCDVVVVKCGVRGAYVSSGNSGGWVPAYATHSVFPLGSGDVFSAWFAYRWAERKEHPVKAATHASRATAYYCANRSLPLPADASKLASRSYKPTAAFPKMKVPSVYLAGPFFNLGQRWLIDELRAALQAQGLRVFSPIHDVGEGDASVVAQADLDGIRGVDVVLACLDGSDAGTVFEAGYAKALNIPVVGLTTGPVRPHDLTMLEGTQCHLVHDVASAVYVTTWVALEARK
jgi:hypothetical protein